MIRTPGNVSPSTWRKMALCLLYLLLCLPVSAQAPPKTLPAFSPELRDQLQAIRGAALNSDYAWQQLAHLTENIGPRPSGSLAAHSAVEYAAAQLKSLG